MFGDDSSSSTSFWLSWAGKHGYLHAREACIMLEIIIILLDTKPHHWLLLLLSPDRLYKAPTDNTTPQQTLQSPKKIVQSPKILSWFVSLIGCDGIGQVLERRQAQMASYDELIHTRSELRSYESFGHIPCKPKEAHDGACFVPLHELLEPVSYGLWGSPV